LDSSAARFAGYWKAKLQDALGDNARAWELTGMINPVNRSLTRAAMETYKVEPYVISADVYAVAPHTGRGGWSWYTGSAGWMYRLVLESLLGLSLEKGCLRFTPRLPAHWAGFTMRYRHRETFYDIEVINTPAQAAHPIRLSVDGVAQPGGLVHMADDRATHAVRLELGTAPTR